jgi:rod shape-determining protein MreC
MRLFRTKHGRTPFKSFVICLFLSLFLLAVPSRVAGPARLAVTTPLAWAQGGMLRVSGTVAAGLGLFTGGRGASREAAALREEVTRLRAQLYQESERRHAAESRLAQMGQLPAEARERALPAAVCAFDPAPERATAVFDRGSRFGVTVNAPVVWNGAVVGRVDAVGPWTSRAVLMGDRGCVIGVRCARSRVQGTLEGIGGGMSRVKYVPDDADVQPGDMFVTSGVDGIFPRGLLVGRCVEVSTESGESFKWIVVKPEYDRALLEHVAILLLDDSTPSDDGEAE